MKLKSNFNLPYLFAFLLIGLTIVACNKDEGPGTTSDPMDPMVDPEPVVTTVAEDKENIQHTVDNMLVCVEDMTSARAIDVLLRDFLNVSEGSAYNEEWNLELSDKFENVFDFAHIDENGRFNLVHHAGWYMFNHATDSWIKNPVNNNTVTVQFPTSPDLSANNSMIVIDEYVDQAIVMDGEEVFAPQKIHAFMNVEGEKIFELNLNNVTYNDNASFQIPVEVDASLFMDPMTLDLDVVRTSSTEFTGMFAFNDGSACRMSIEADVELADDDLENLTEESIEKVHAKIRLGDMTIQSLAGLADLLAMEEPTQSEINTLLDLDVLFQDIKIADLEYDEVEDNFVIHYKDESTERKL